MRKLFLFVFTTMLAGQVWAYDFMSNGICYSYTNGGVVVSPMNTNNLNLNYPSLTGTVTIPDKVNDNPVIGIETKAFMNGLFDKIIIGDSVKTIGDNAFNACKSMKQIIIGKSIKNVGVGAFYQCSNLKEVICATDKPDGWDNSNCGASTLRWNTRFIGDFLYQIINKDLQTVQIVDYFGENTELSDFGIITFDNVEYTVTAIDNNAFKDCASLITVEIPNSVTSIGANVFEGCSALTTISIPDGIKSISNSLLAGCGNLTSIEIPNSVTKIGEQAFQNCSGLTSITIPDNVTSIGTSAFDGCDGLISINISANVTSIGEGAFAGCSNLTSINVASENAYYCSENGALLNNDKTAIICYPAGSPNTSYIIPDGVKSLSKGVFKDCHNLKSVIVPNSVENIAVGAFSGCSSLETITLPFVGESKSSSWPYCTLSCIFGNDNYPGSIGISTSYYNIHFYVPSSLKSVTVTGGVIKDKAFVDCNMLESIIFGGSIKTIGGDNGDVCNACDKLKTVVIGDSVTSISRYAFYGAHNLKYVIIGKSVSNIGEAAFNSNNTIFYSATPRKPSGWYKHPDERKRAWDSGMGTVYFGVNALMVGDFICKVISDTIPYRVSLLHYIAGDVDSIVIPATVSLKGIEYAVTSIDGSFSPNANLKTVIIGDSVTSIGNVFRKCTDLQYNEYDNALYLGNADNPYLALIKAKSLDISSCDISNKCKIICEGAFNNCGSLTSITIPNSVTSIGTAAFDGCSGLNYAIIPNSVTSIGRAVFENCNQLVVYCGAKCPPEGWNINWNSNNRPVVWGVSADLRIINITLMTSNSDYGIVEGGGYVIKDSITSIVATPAKGYHFARWSNGSTDNPLMLIASSDTTLTALFEAHTAVADTAVPATCTKSGLTEGSHCSVCNKVLVAQETVAAKGHTEVVDAGFAPTCTEFGITNGKHCSVCNIVVVAQDTIPALGHEFVNYVYNNDATTEADGTETAVCEHGCGASDTHVKEGTKLATTAVTESVADNLVVYAVGKTIIIENANDEIRVYNAMGALVGRDVARNVSTITVNTTGVYIVKTGNVAKRVMVN